MASGRATASIGCPRLSSTRLIGQNLFRHKIRSANAKNGGCTNLWIPHSWGNWPVTPFPASGISRRSVGLSAPSHERCAGHIFILPCLNGARRSLLRRAQPKKGEGRPLSALSLFGVPAGNRTRNLQRRRLSLYPIALRTRARIPRPLVRIIIANFL